MDENKERWLTSSALHGLMHLKRDNDVRVKINDTLVPLIDVRYDSRADMYVLDLDEDGDEYKIAMGL